MAPRTRQAQRARLVLIALSLYLFLFADADAAPAEKKAKGKKGQAGGKSDGKGGKLSKGSGGGIKTKMLEREGTDALQRGDLTTAADKFSQASAIDPGYSDYHTQRASALRGLGRKKEAVDEYLAAIEGMDEDRNKAGGGQYWAAVHINLGYLYAEGGGPDGGMEKAAAAFAKATQLAPGFEEAYTYWGNALQELGQQDEALAVFQKGVQAVSQGPENAAKRAMLHFHIANCHGSLGRQDEALKSYQEATKVNPTLAAAWTNMGTIYQVISLIVLIKLFAKVNSPSKPSTYCFICNSQKQVDDFVGG